MRYLKGKTVDHVIAERDQVVAIEDELRDLTLRLKEAEANGDADSYQMIIERGTELQARLASMAVEELLIRQDETTAFITCGLMLEDCFTFFGVTAGANAIESLAYLIVSEFGHHLSATELGMLLRDGKAGKFGKLYGKLDSNQIVEWIKAYLSIRQQKYADRNLNKHLALRPASDAPRKSGTLRELFDGQGAYKSTQPK